MTRHTSAANSRLPVPVAKSTSASGTCAPVNSSIATSAEVRAPLRACCRVGRADES